MNDFAWTALGTFVITLGGTLVLTTLGIKRFSETVQASLDTKIDRLHQQIVQMELAYERKLSQNDAGIRAQIKEVEFYVRDNYVKEPVFQQMIDLFNDNNANQFRSMQTQLDRIFDKLENMAS